MPRPRMFGRGTLRRKFSTGSQKAKEPLPSLDVNNYKSHNNNNSNNTAATTTASTNTTTLIGTLSDGDADWIVRKTENRVAEIVAASEFIQKNTRLHKLPRFSHEDLELADDMIAHGGFCDVRAIKGFKVDAGVLDRGTVLGNRRQYVIKHLSPKLLQKHKQLAIGAKDLVMEAYILSALEHENILSVKGYSASGVSGYASTGRLDGFFLILPRLDKTLHKQLHEWRVAVNRQRLELGQKTIGGRRGSGNNKNNNNNNNNDDEAEDEEEESSAQSTPLHNSSSCAAAGADKQASLCLDEYEEADSEASNNTNDSSESDAESFDPEQFPFFVPRIQTAVEIASAIAYCHRNRILVRDLKPANVGYDFEEDRVKIFDFGLAIELPPSREPDELFRLPGNTGTARYMAPEVIRAEPYGFKADVYSFCTLLQEIMALVKPFEKLGGKEVKEQVAVFGHRPPIDKSWPTPVKQMLRRGFSESLMTRPHMEEIQDMLEDLVDY